MNHADEAGWLADPGVPISCWVQWHTTGLRLQPYSREVRFYVL